MLSHSFFALVALAASSFLWVPETQACHNHGGSPAYWLANLRNSTGTTSPFMNAPGVRKIRFSDGAAPVLLSAFEKDELERSGFRYFDVTENDLDEVRAQRAAAGDLNLVATFPSGPTHQSEVKAIISTLSIDNLKSDLAVLTAYNNRYYRSSTGAASANDLAAKLKTIASAAPGTGGAITVKTFSNTFTMPSVIARIEGTNPTAPVVIIGAHLDTINQGSPMNGRAPGADDDGSGSVNLIEAFRKMTAAGFKPANPVEYHWYAGEEGGLLGSSAIAKAYASAGTAVRGMLQLDMTGYVKPGTNPVVGFITDYVDASLTAFTKTLINAYLTNIGIAESKCGYACSDHASWTSSGYSSVFPFESTFSNDNPSIHGDGDTVNVNGFDWDHSLQFTKLAVAFLMELSLPGSATPSSSSSSTVVTTSTSSTRPSSTTTTARPTSTTSSSSRRSTTTTTSSNACPRWWPNCPWA
ncbi:Leucine aminopeptidase 1; AltName: Full=Leucyl aminopeptidase 1; Short=LAP1; Flags: Precursor [Serendipita indica DSM 11827]|nr:Leucine aminopeptidase 1; AltName: Full=Leucyl aminopeptidase 1; Short=LAP1; Flags: Precursor [Serendipita indica DSM 11827]